MSILNLSKPLICKHTAPLEGNTIAPPLEMGKSYKLLQIAYDSDGNPHYDVGIESTVSFVRSYETKEELPNGDEIWWCHPSRFIQ